MIYLIYLLLSFYIKMNFNFKLFLLIIWWFVVRLIVINLILIYLKRKSNKSDKILKDLNLSQDEIRMKDLLFSIENGIKWMPKWFYYWSRHLIAYMWDLIFRKEELTYEKNYVLFINKVTESYSSTSQVDVYEWWFFAKILIITFNYSIITSVISTAWSIKSFKPILKLLESKWCSLSKDAKLLLKS